MLLLRILTLVAIFGSLLKFNHGWTVGKFEAREISASKWSPIKTLGTR